MQEYAVIIPTHDRPEFLKRALESVLNQTIPPLEIVIIDDASAKPVSFPEMMRGCRVTVVRTKQCVGGAAARNIGLSSARSPIVAFLDDDDEWLPVKMAKQLRYFETHPDAVLVSCGHFRVEGGTEYVEKFSEDFVARYREYDNFWGSFSFIVINRGALGETAILDPDIPALEDWEFALRITRGRTFGIIQEPLVRYYAHDLPRLTTRRSNQFRGLRKCYFKHRRSFSQDAQRWLLSRLIFERSLLLARGRMKRRMVISSVLLGLRSELPWRDRLRAVVGRLGSLFIARHRVISMRSGFIAAWQRLRRWSLAPFRLLDNGRLSPTFKSPALADAPTVTSANVEKPVITDSSRTSIAAESLSSSDIEPGELPQVQPPKEADDRSPVSPNIATPRVLMVTGRADFGGGPEHVHQLSKKLIGHAEVFIACPREEPYWKRYADLVGEQRMLEIPRRSVAPAAILAIARFVRQHQIAIVHTHGRSAGVCGRFASMATRTPCIHTPHGSTPVENLKTFAYACVEYLLSLFTRKIIAVSTNEAIQLHRLCAGRERLRIIPNGVEIPQETVNQTEALMPPLRILHATRFVYQKNTELIVPICEELRRCGMLGRFRFTFFGEGPGRAAFEATVRKSDLEEHIEILGAVNSLREPLTKSFCVLSTSRWEGLPLALLEAMALGVPVVATDVVGNRDAVSDGETGLLYDSKTPEQAARQIVRIAEDAAFWQGLSINSRRRAELLFSSDVMGASTLALYRELLSPRGAGSTSARNGGSSRTH